MSLSAHLLEQIEAEHAASRRVIERIGDGALSWQPHDKSMPALDLSTHVANLVSWGAMILTTDGLDFASEEMQNWKPPTADDVAGVLAILDENVATVKGILDGMSDEELQKTWTMRTGENVMSSDSRIFAFSRWVLSHMSHHRGQLTLYLRLQDVPVPGIFGPSADEQWDG